MWTLGGISSNQELQPWTEWYHDDHESTLLQRTAGAYDHDRKFEGVKYREIRYGLLLSQGEEKWGGEIKEKIWGNMGNRVEKIQEHLISISVTYGFYQHYDPRAWKDIRRPSF